MQIVIDIPKTIYTNIKSAFNIKLSDINTDKVIKAIKNGTPLLKGHGIEQEPCTAKEKIGHWEYVQYDGNPNIGNWHCSECNRIVCGAIKAANPTYAYKFCPECGAKMVKS